MRLRQVALVAGSLAPAEEELCAVLGLKVAYRDPGVGVFGLENVVAPVGGEFVEIVAPVEAETAAGRYLARRGGNGGYMVILQCPDAIAERRRIMDLGLRTVWRTDRPGYRATHFHPRDAGGVLLSVDSVAPGVDHLGRFCSWPPAGPDWQDAVRGERVDGLAGVELQSDDPQAMADLWARILNRPEVEQEGDQFRISLDGGTLRFVAATDGRGPGVGGIDLRAADANSVIEAAAARGLKRTDNQIELCGTRVNLV